MAAIQAGADAEEIADAWDPQRDVAFARADRLLWWLALTSARSAAVAKRRVVCADGATWAEVHQQDDAAFALVMRAYTG